MFCFSRHVAESCISCQISLYFVLHANQIPKDLNYSQHSMLTLPLATAGVYYYQPKYENHSVEKLVIFRDLHLQLQLLSCRKPQRRGKQTTAVFRGL